MPGSSGDFQTRLKPRVVELRSTRQITNLSYTTRLKPHVPLNCSNGGKRAHKRTGEVQMRSIILYILGVPVTVIVLIALFTHHF